jgi:hypothetical protein
VGAELAKVLMRFRQILAAGVFSFVKVRDSIKTKSVYA